MSSPFRGRTHTHTSFDGYDSDRPRQDNNSNTRMTGSGETSLNAVGVTQLRAVPALMHARENIPKALMIESLIELLCRQYTNDPRKGNLLFKAICEILYKTQFLDHSLLVSELKPTRERFTLNFHQLFTNVRDSLPNQNLAKDVRFSVGTFLKKFQILEIENGSTDGAVYVHNSQYLAEFEEERCIGKGGFGIVCKAKKKVDQHHYAVKKIPFDHSDDHLFSQIIREVMVFAKLSHPNVVSYKTAWIERGGADIILNITGSSEESDASEENESERCEDMKFNEMDTCQTTETLEEIEWMQTESVETINVTSTRSFLKETVKAKGTRLLKRSTSMQQDNNDTENSPIAFVPTQRLRKKSLSDPSGDACKALCTLDEGLSKKNMNSVLFVQMELCQENLRVWLDKRVEQISQSADKSIVEVTDEHEVMNIFKQVLEGVAYLHQNELVHRDLKPQNIMFDGNRIAKIGDFGLAKVCCECDTNNRRPWVSATGHTKGVGTSPYAAPEQLHRSNYDSKADMYSLGVILFELLVPFTTNMERAKVLQDVERGIVPDDVRNRYPEQMETVLRLVNKSPSRRPSAVEILNSAIFLSKEQQLIQQLTFENADLKKQLNDRDVKIRELERIVKCKTAEPCTST